MNLKKINSGAFEPGRLACRLLLGLVLLSLPLTGCEPMVPNQETLLRQTEYDLQDDGENADLPVIEDVYHQSVHEDVYGADQLKLP
ncbi:hypothetical protein AWM70_10870 [Paenibacillus yonginensis]|uniref:Uncharacterized protein n=1 Tax=Paenibacillus yonginensis TaxID=1462996 RepID=A0A1B1N0U5_9BACL|nr:hypothetical protein [Paenibacillus yonginensis]ANS75043.1 hypothetical protein AWM70_10870 [Paenibacillus yonginensis]